MTEGVESCCSHPSDVVALTGCTRASLGVHASSSGAIAGLVSWKVRGGATVDVVN